MHNAIRPSPNFTLAIAPGVPSSRLSALLALQRAHEPGVAIAVREVSDQELVTGLHEGRYDAGLSLSSAGDHLTSSRRLWCESMAVAIPPRFRLVDQAKLTISDLQDYPIYRWQAEACPLLDERLASLMPVDQENILPATSFEMMALWVSAGYGIGVCAQSRIERAHQWGIGMRPLADGPYEIVTYLQRPHAQADSAAKRFERRALQIAEAGAL